MQSNTAANLFRQLREVDAMELDLIVAERLPEEGLGVALMDRLSPAAESSHGPLNRLTHCWAPLELYFKVA